MNLYNIGENVYSISLEIIIRIQGILSAGIVDGACSRDSLDDIERVNPNWRKGCLYLYRHGSSPMKMIPESDLIREESLTLTNE
jgi:hypothetical protein